jgi:hypothetical protein
MVSGPLRQPMRKAAGNSSDQESGKPALLEFSQRNIFDPNEIDRRLVFGEAARRLAPACGGSQQDVVAFSQHDRMRRAGEISARQWFNRRGLADGDAAAAGTRSRHHDTGISNIASAGLRHKAKRRRECRLDHLDPAAGLVFTPRRSCRHRTRPAAGAQRPGFHRP